jgi:radical SAM protein with 4Fe4S-binding SPASM domain
MNAHDRIRLIGPLRSPSRANARTELEQMSESTPHFASGGVHHATINGHRFHLRPTEDGALLWLNGRQPPYHLDQTAADFVVFIIEAMWTFQQGDGDESEQVVSYVVDQMLAKYGRRRPLRRRVTRTRVTADLHRIFGTLSELARGMCPAELGLDPRELRPETWTAPARMDLAVTYRCNLNCAKCYAGGSRADQELPTDKWIEVYRTLWQIGVPQVVFTGGEPTLREDIVELVGRAEEFVSGLVTNGTKLAALAAPLHAASLDYTQVTIESHQPQVHDAMTGAAGSHAQTVAGIEAARTVGLQVVTNTTLTKQNAAHFADTIAWLHEALGVEHMACNTLICSGRGAQHREENGLSDAELVEVLRAACERARGLGVELQWYSPGCYHTLDPIALGFGPKGCSAAAHNMLVQPDGSVLPCQSWPDAVGNILTDPWEQIWSHETCRKLRDHRFAPEACAGCGWSAVCGGGCPLDRTPRQQPERSRGATR